VNALKFYIRFPDGRSEELVVDSDRLLIGSGAHCEIRLPIEEAALEHVMIQALPNGNLIAHATATQPPPMINGAPFVQAPLLPGAILSIGQVQIMTAMIEVADDGGLFARGSKKKMSPVSYALAILMIPLAAYLLLFPDDDSEALRPPSDFPQLWDAPVTSCPQQAPAQALAFASDKYTQAAGRRERRPFRVQEGVAAVPLYELASVCFKIGDRPDLARESGDIAQKLRAEVDLDYRTHRVRLEHALSVSDLQMAHKEVRVLLALTEGKQGQYVTWLSNLDRRLQLKFGKKGP
jgi:hypothetical protein